MQSRLLLPLTELSVALTSLTVGPVAVCSTLRLALLQPFIVLAEGLMMMLIKDAEDLCLPSPPPSLHLHPFTFLLQLHFSTSRLHLSSLSVISSHQSIYTHLCHPSFGGSRILSPPSGGAGGRGGAAINVRGLLKWDHRSESSRVSVK